MSEEKYANLKQEARHNKSRVKPEGIALNAQTMRLYVSGGLEKLSKDGVPDERCGTPLCNEAVDRIDQLERELSALRADAKVMCASLAAWHYDDRGGSPDADLVPLLDAVETPYDFDADQQVMRRIFQIERAEG